jgi:membrane-associated phospholipid phosphatase
MHMGEWLQSLVPWGTEIIVWAQTHSNAALDGLFVAFTTLGYEEFYLLVLPLVYWCLNKQVGTGLAYISLLSAWVNSAIKYLFAIPRPADPRIEMKAPRLETSPSFPSGHAQNALVNWGYLAISFRSPIFRVLAVVAILGISLSRVFLGVHYPQDIVGGWLIGLVLLVGFSWLAPPTGRWLANQPLLLQLSAAVLLPVLLMLLHPAGTQGRALAESSVTPMSALAGLGVGIVMERRWVRFQVAGVWWRRLLRFVFGLAIAMLFYAGPKLLLPEGLSHDVETVARFVRYGLLGWVVAFASPWLFVRLQLAEQEPVADSA